jgi:DNA-binding NarL/FixJ family response regulator
MSIYVIDDHPLMRGAVAVIVRRLCPDATIVELDRLDKLNLLVQQHGAPSLFCLDLELIDTGGISTVVTVKRRYPKAAIAVYSGTPASQMKAACLQAGANAYIEKSANPAELTAALRGLLTPGAEAEEAPAATAPEKLSKRQSQLIVMLDQGLGNRDIATRLNISEHTVKVHLWRLFHRLGVKSRTQALHYARTHGFLPGYH